MSSKITNNANNDIDLLLEILRKSRTLKASTEKKKENITQTETSKYIRNSKLSSISSDIDGKLMLSVKNNDLNLRKNDKQFQNIKKYIEDIINRMTKEDYKLLYEEGFRIEDLSIEALSLALQYIKEYNSTDNSREDSDRSQNSKESKDNLIRKMESFNLPVTKESVDRINGALKLSEEIPNLEKKDVLYLLKKDLPFTIENLYKARYSRQNKSTVKKLSDSDWQELLPQIEEAINKTGLFADNSTIDNARWLIENDLPITKDNLKIVSGIDNLSKNYDKDQILNKILKGMRNGAYPEDVVLLDDDKLLDGESTYSTEDLSDPDWEKVKHVIENIHENYDSEIIKAVKTDREMTLKGLEELRTSDNTVEYTEDELTKEELAKVLAAKRQLEEIRLKMTAEAALRLERKGFSIDTRPLQEVVERLRYEEENYFRQLYEIEGIRPDENQIENLRLTTQSVRELKVMPAYILGATLHERDQQTMTGLLNAGKNMLDVLEKAKEAYEPLLTKPRSDYGDSIQKAFANMDSLMNEMSIEDTVYNRRAIRILAYNRMEITYENIEQVKAYDLKVNYLLNNLNPAVAVQIIKNGINPMDLNIEELNSLIEKLKSQGYSSLEKYSNYLYKLEKEGEISQAEKKAYIGIYRLLYQLDKSDGAALGAVIKSGREMTLNHLLSALRTNQKVNTDYKIDDEFGLLKDITYENETITDQLGAVFENQADQGNFAQGEILQSIVKQLLDSLSPEKLYGLHRKIKENSPYSTEAEVWDTIGNMTVEKLFDEIRDMKTDTGANQDFYYERLKELREIYTNCDQAIRFLNDFKLPCTTTNLIMAEYVLSNKDTLFKNMKKQLKKTDDLTDTLIDKKTMNEAYDELEKEVNELIDRESEGEEIDSFKLNRLRSLGLQMQFIRNLAKREFYHIPVEVGGKITHVNLTIIRGKGEKGKVSVNYTSDSLGSIKAEATIKDNKLSGYFVCDNAEGLNLLKEQADKLKRYLENENLDIKQINFCLQRSPENIRGYINTEETQETGNPETEKILYRVAKAILNMITSAEETDIVSHREVAD